MSNRNLGIILLVVGILIVVAVLLAAPLGLANAGFGIKKIAGLVIGAAAFIVGLVMTMRNKAVK